MSEIEITEVVLHSIDDSEFLGELGIPKASNDRIEFWHVAFSPKWNPPRILFGSTIEHTSIEDCRCTLTEYLQRSLTPKTINEAATLLSTYAAAHPWLWPGIKADQIRVERYLDIGIGLKSCFKSDHIVDDILSESRGLLLWNDQLDRLISLFIGRPSERNKLRKRLNLKHVDAWIASHKMLFPSGISLAGVISERTINNCVSAYQLSPAVTLFEITASIGGRLSWPHDED